MPEDAVHLWVDGRPVRCRPGSTVAAALDRGSGGIARRSSGGDPRGALCGMGSCFECRVTIDGVPHRLACQAICREGMKVSTETGEGRARKSA